MPRQKAASTLTRRQREFRARQQEIITAARSLFIKNGYYNTTLEEIAQHAEFGKGTIYNYFGSKEDLFQGIIDELTAEVFSIAEKAIATTPGGAREKFTAYGTSMIIHARAQTDLFNVLMREFAHLQPGDARLKDIHRRAHSLWNILAKPLRVAMRRGEIRRVDPLQLAALFDSMLRIYGAHRLSPFELATPAQVEGAVHLVVSTFFDGIAVRKSKE
jgi:TetR/AcrR family transcriptional regulator, repressor of fatR-cypB operon